MNTTNTKNNLVKNTNKDLSLLQKLEPFYDDVYFSFSHREVKIINALSEKNEFDFFIKEYALKSIGRKYYKAFLNRYVKNIPFEYQLELCEAMSQHSYYPTESVRAFFIKLQRKLLSATVDNIVSEKTKVSERL